ncbi:hypothetical protein [Nocardia nova]|uniref:hypothetical protein n=1 Tax=Nocardia nova TaxID=37330 RepID=UPI00273A4505|nr:hypothetical protein [Nocardia nova]
MTDSGDSPGTYRVSDGSAVPFNDALRQWALVAHDVLVDTASKRNEFITYKDLAEQVQALSGIRTRSQMRNWIGRGVLGRVAERCHAAGEPPLTALCVRKDQTVGDGYRYVLELAGLPIPEDLEMHAAYARRECYRRYAPDFSDPHGEPALPPRVEAARRAAAKAQPSPPALCADCYTQLPSNGICDYCG